MTFCLRSIVYFGDEGENYYERNIVFLIFFPHRLYFYIGHKIISVWSTYSKTQVTKYYITILPSTYYKKALCLNRTLNQHMYYYLGT